MLITVTKIQVFIIPAVSYFLFFLFWGSEIRMNHFDSFFQLIYS